MKKVSKRESIKRLTELRDVVLPKIPDNELRMAGYTCGTKHCLAGWAAVHPAFNKAGLVFDNGCVVPKYRVSGKVVGEEDEFFGLDQQLLAGRTEEWWHIFSTLLPNDKSILAANITDLIEYRRSL